MNRIRQCPPDVNFLLQVRDLHVNLRPEIKKMYVGIALDTIRLVIFRRFI